MQYIDANDCTALKNLKIGKSKKYLAKYHCFDTVITTGWTLQTR